MKTLTVCGLIEIYLCQKPFVGYLDGVCLFYLISLESGRRQRLKAARVECPIINNGKITYLFIEAEKKDFRDHKSGVRWTS